MAYETGTPSSIQDLIDKLQTFLGAEVAWTVDDFDTTERECTIHQGSDMVVSFAWDNTDQTDLAIYQSLGYVGGNDPWDMTDDSGAGDTTPSTVDSGRRVNFESTGPYVAYHFFASDDAPYYCHVVVEVTSGVFRHFGFGTLAKVNDWTGGEYSYGHFWSQSANDIDNPVSAQHAAGLEANGTTSAANVMHIEGVGNMGASSKWGAFANSPGSDRAANARAVLMGGMRGGWWARFLQAVKNSATNALVPIIPIPVFYKDTAPTPDLVIYLGQMRHIGVINMANLSAGDEFTVGAETWVVFPWVRKQYLVSNTEESWNAGWAYRKIL